MQADLFKLFSNPRLQDHSSTSVGLGLAYCKAVISKLRGTIRCLSRIGEGTTISFSINVGKEVGDNGLTLREEHLHQFEIAKLIRNNFIPADRDEVELPRIRVQDGTLPDAGPLSSRSDNCTKTLVFSGLKDL